MSLYRLSQSQLGEYLDMAYHSNPHFQKNFAPRLEKLHGADDLTAMFGKGKPYPESMKTYKLSKDPNWTIPKYEEFEPASPTTTIPWDQSTPNKAGQRYDAGLVHRTIALEDDKSIGHFDPRYLHGVQPSVTAPGVLHYLQHGQARNLYADKADVGNQFPFVYIHSGTGEHRLLGGHHRAASALLKNELLVARFAVGDY